MTPDKLNPLHTEKPRTDWPQNDAEVWASIPNGDPRRAPHDEKLRAVLDGRNAPHSRDKEA